MDRNVPGPLVTLASLFVALGLVFAPSGSASAGRSHVNSTRAQVGTVTITDPWSMENFDPFYYPSAFGYLLFEGLTKVNNRGQVIPNLLVRLPNSSNHEVLDGGKTLLLELRRHEYWSSGAEITSSDVVLGWRVERSLHRCFRACTEITSVVAVGRYTVRMTLSRPDPGLLACCLPAPLPHTWGVLSRNPAGPAAGFETVDYTNPSAWTDGPYRILHYDRLVSAVFTPMKYYRLHPGPRIKRLTYVPHFEKDIPGIAARGQADVTQTDALELPALLSHRHSYSVLITPTFDQLTILFNVLDATYNSRPNPVHDVRVRQALALATDRVALAALQRGLGKAAASRTIANSPFLITKPITQMDVSHLITGAWDPFAKRYVPYGPRARRDARRLLREAGYGAGVQIALATQTIPGPDPFFDTIKRDWSGIGVQTVKLQDCSVSCDASLLVSRQFEAYLGTVRNGPDPDVLRHELGSEFTDDPKDPNNPSELNFSGIQDRVIDQGLRNGGATYDPKQRRRWYDQVQVRVVRQAYWVPLMYGWYVTTFDRRVRGVTGNPLGEISYAWNASQWRSVP